MNREAFEAWFISEMPMESLIVDQDNNYKYQPAIASWEAWQAALASQAQQELAKQDTEKRYRFLLGWLIERGVITNTRYDNGTWVMRGIYGVDDSGLKGAGISPEQAIDNAIIAHGLDQKSSNEFWKETHAAIVQPPAPEGEKE